MRESKVKDYLSKRVKDEGGFIRKVEWVGRNGAPDQIVGFPEQRNMQYVIRHGCCAWFELKATDGELKIHQEREHKKMRECGMTVFVTYTIEEVDIALSIMLPT